MSTSVTPPPKPSGPNGPLAAAIAAAMLIATPFVMKWEGNPPVSYADIVGVPTACWGHTGRGVIVGRRYSSAECQALLSQDMKAHAEGIARCITVDVPPESLAAFVSFSFNVGVSAFCNASLTRRLNAGDLRGACAGLSAWVYAGGKRVQGLVNRRADERALCERGLS